MIAHSSEVIDINQPLQETYTSMEWIVYLCLL